MVTDTSEHSARDKAVAQLKKRRDFLGHLLIYVLVNASPTDTGSSGRCSSSLGGASAW